MASVGICGTFDVENYGDLLFPLIAAYELGQRLNPLDLQCFSYSAKSASNWPFAVTSFTDLAATVDQLRGVIIGGGHIVRFDKVIAPDYFPPDNKLHHPLSIWLTPALLALEQGLPVVWNAPAVYGAVPQWIAPLLIPALSGSNYIAVRDQESRQALAPFARGAEISVVPDTVFCIANLRDRNSPSSECKALRERIGVRGPYIVVQATTGLDAVARVLSKHAATFAAYQVLVLPMGPVLGDSAAVVARCFPQAMCLPEWPNPLLLAELIGGAEAAIGISLHLAITALAYGVPVFRPQDSTHGKYGFLSDFDTIHLFDPIAEIVPEWLQSRFGKKAPSAAVENATKQLKIHWDTIANILSVAPTRNVPIGIRDTWQVLPGALEATAVWQAKHAQAQHDIEHLRIDVANLRNSLSWKLTAPLRAFADFIQGRRRIAVVSRTQTSSAHTSITAAVKPELGGVMQFEAIERQTLQHEPYSWARITDLYLPENAQALAATFPRDHYKTVKGYDGEKDYRYEARELIGMGSDSISNAAHLSAAWRALAADLLSPRYRAALSQLTGIDLSMLQMEANVFHYGPGAWLGPHLDLRDKIVTHVLYFNPTWNTDDGGCLQILRSSNMQDAADVVSPIVGSSAILVRSDKSWHAVSRVDPRCTESRRSMTVTFYCNHAISTMWPPGDTTPTHEYR